MGALPACASSTSRAICATAVSLPTRVARTSSRPNVLTVPPATSSPGPTSTGTGSPVSIDRSTAESPSSITPSVANLSPGRTMNRSPVAIVSTGTTTSCPSRSTRASFAPSSSKARIAAPDRRRAPVSRKRPRRINVVITAPTSKYVCASSSARSPTTDQVQAARVPIEISVSIVTAPWRAFRAAARWNGHPAHQTTGVASASASHSHPSNWSGGAIASTTSGALREAARASRIRSRSGGATSAAARVPTPARYPAASTARIRSSTAARLGS